ncbi:TonB-dependent siderophore receptor [Phytopseudomonas punonensis]|uniref:Metal-pseudopaline receptor CntO n=1 Tax=Phytopseudomonas punonensis TaxID=1220495 RepID=A0A1M7KVV7_9GAMM|nr:TonB-dependent siderophore receptor [Pseudomonas punonensis]SHM69658.1 iron complex outermembrane recepter protein [Pseudomonas punonensis]
MSASINSVRRCLARSISAATLGIPVAAFSLVVGAEESSPETIELQPQSIIATPQDERASDPVKGYVATRSVSGTKTDVPITEIPQSISVITADRIRDQGSLTVQDALRYTAGVRGEAFGLDSRVDSVMVRGTSPAMFLDGLQQGVGYYNNTRVDPFTLERIEVLKGPSSMLYGQSPVGGLVNMVSKRPQAEQKTQIQAQYGTFDRKQLAIDTTGPLNEDGTLLYRVVAIKRDSGSQVDHVHDNRSLLMPSLTWKPNDDIEWTVLANVQKDDSVSSSQFLPHEGTLYKGRGGRLSSSTFAGEPGFDEYDTEQVALTSNFSWRLDDTWTVRQNLRWQKSKASYQTVYGWPWVYEADGRTINRVSSISKPEVKMWTADHQGEARFDTGAVQHTLLIGTDYQHSVANEKVGGGDPGALDLYNPIYTGYDGSDITLSDNPEQRVVQQGLYVQDQIRYENWLLTLGLRRDWADNKTEGSRAQKDDATTGRAGLTYLFDNGVAPYISYSESFQPVIGLNNGLTPYKPLEGEQWEMGIKYQPVGSNSLYTAAVFDLREKNRQMSDPNDPNNTLQSGETRVRGLELEAQVEVTSNWDLIGTYTKLDTETLEGEAVNKGKRIESVPDNMASVWSKHRFSVAGIPGFSVGAGVRYVGASWDGQDDLKTPSTTLFDAMLGYQYQNWDFSVNATNLADETYYTTCLARGDCFTGNRRTVTGTVAYNF